jgi:hypothetical protein
MVYTLRVVALNTHKAKMIEDMCESFMLVYIKSYQILKTVIFMVDYVS